jgi:phage-related protein
MFVSYLEAAKKEAEKLHAKKVFSEALKALMEAASWEELIKQNDVRDFKGGAHKGAYEIKIGPYRSVFVLIINGVEALIFGFFKKEGRLLKRTELKTIEQRLKRIKQEYES